MRTFWPVPILPENTRPKAVKRLSAPGIILETYIIRGAPSEVSQVRMAVAASSSRGPSYRVSHLYSWAVAGEGRWTTIISSTASAAGSHFCMMYLRRGLPVMVFLTSSDRLTPTAAAMLWALGVPFLVSSLFMMAWNIPMMGSMMKATKARLAPVSLSTPLLVLTLVELIHLDLPSAVWKTQSPQSFSVIFSSVVLNLEAYTLAKVLRVKPHWWRPEPKATLPLRGTTCQSRSWNL
mmetsp:Transcript_61817/g.108621  ORF Transcript_61817/g.108621 Transcript_61817/m.108621 type:complete len:236 (+) Transcript_61817:142-849(+)